MEAGAIHDSGDLVAAFAWAISTELDPDVAALGDTLDDVESDLESSQLYRLRRTITEVRSQAIGYRRFVAPDRDALRTLAALDFDWLAETTGSTSSRRPTVSPAGEARGGARTRRLAPREITDLRSEQLDQRSCDRDRGAGFCLTTLPGCSA